MQPGLVLRHILLMEGMYPSRGEGYPGTPPEGGSYLGEIRMYAGGTVFNDNRCPEAAGQIKSIQQYTAVFSLLGTYYGGNGIQNFALPDLRGARPIPVGQGQTLSLIDIGEKVGAEKVGLVPANLPSHRHQFHYMNVDSTGSGVGLENRQPGVGVRYLINASGELRMFAGNFTPEGWAFAEGQLLPIEQYPELYATLGTTWGGDGQSTFALPDLRGRVPVGAGNGPGLTPRVLGDRFGSETTTLNTSNLPPHDHTYEGSATSSTYSLPAGFSTVEPSAAVQFGVTMEGIYPSENGGFQYGMPVFGEIVMYAGTVLPEHVLPADGRLLPIAENEALFSLLGTTYGGNGETTFALPDLRGRTPLGRGTGSGLTPRVLGQQVGAETHALAAAELPPHQHSVSQTPATINNPSFEADNFTVYPGYSSGNGGSISGWFWSGQAGLNPSNGSPFANNGAVPNGSKVAFLQSNNLIPCSLATTVVGLTPGTTYTVSFRANCRDYNGNQPAPTWSINNGAQGPSLPFTASPFKGGTNPYYSVSGSFTASATYADIVVSNQSILDSAVLLDDFKITAASSPPWSVTRWDNDATSGIYNVPGAWAYALGNSLGGIVNNLIVGGQFNVNPQIPGRLKINGFTSRVESDFTIPGNAGGSELGKSFHYGATNGSITLEGLLPGSSYRLLFFGAGFDTDQLRLSTFAADNDSCAVDENRYGLDQGVLIQHNFTADSATRVVQLQAHNPGSTFHLYGIALIPDDPQMSVELVNNTPLPALVDFGFVEYPLPSATIQAFVRNRGLKPLLVDAINLGGGNTSRFEVQPATAATILPGDSRAITLKYLASNGGPAQATMAITSNDPTFATGNFTLKGDSAVTYAYWKATEFPGNPANSGASADPDGDGIPNQLEYAFRSNPKGANLSPVELPSTVAGGTRRFTFPYLLLAGDITYTLQRSTDLSAWTDVYTYKRVPGGTPLISGVSGSANSSTQTIEVNVPDGALFEGANFWRVKVAP